MSHILDVIIKAKDQATTTTKKVEQNIKNMGNTGKTTWQQMDKAQQQALLNLSSKGPTTMNKFRGTVQRTALRVKSVWNKMSNEMKLALGAALTTGGMYLTNFLRDSVEVAKNAQTAWIAFNNSVKNGAKGANVNLEQMKTQMVNVANTAGISTSSARTSFVSLNNILKDNTQSFQAVEAAQALAAGTGKDLQTTTTALVGALNGRGMALKKLGYNIDDYKDKSTGMIDTERLIRDVFNNNRQAYEAYANSAAGVSARLDNSMNSLKTSIGSVLLVALEPLVSTLASAVNCFNQLPGPVKTVVAVSMLLFATFSMLAGPITALIGLLGIVVTEEGALAIEGGILSVAQGALSATTGVLTSAFTALGIAEGVALLPILAITVAIVALIGVMWYLYNNNETVRKSIDALANVIKTVMITAYNTLIKVINKVVNTFKTLYNAFNTAKSLGSQMVNTIINKVKQLPGLIYNEFASIPGKIRQSISNAVSAAGEWGSQVVANLKNKMGIHSPGFIQKAVVKEFEDTSKRILSLTNDAKKAGASYGEAMMGGFGDSGFSLDTDLSRNSRLSVNHTVTVDHDFSNLPSGVSADEVARIVNRTASTREFAQSLTSNMSFQNEDLKMKNRINGKIIRARGA